MKEVDPDNPPWLRPPEPLPGAKNCRTCALFPCLLVKNMPAATEISDGTRFNFARPSMIPMPCGGVEWKEKVTNDRKRSDRPGGAFDQFNKR